MAKKNFAFIFENLDSLELEHRGVTVSKASRSDRNLGKSYLAPKPSSFLLVSEGLPKSHRKDKVLKRELIRMDINLHLIDVRCTQASENLFIFFRGRKKQIWSSGLGAILAETFISNFKSKLSQTSWLQTITGLDPFLVLVIYWGA